MEEYVGQQGRNTKKKAVLIVLVSLVALIVLTYLGLCIYVGESGVILPGVYAEGVELSGMTQEEAQQAMEDWLARRYADASYELRCGDSTARLDGTVVGTDSAEVARQAYLVGRGEPFLKRGAVILAQLKGQTRTFSSPVYLSQAGVQQLDAALKQLSQAEKVLLVETVWSTDGEELVITRGITGMTADTQKTREAFEQVVQQPGILTLEISLIQAEPVPLDLEQVRSQIYVEQADAYVARDEKGKMQVMSHVIGVDFDLAQVQAQFDALAEGETMVVPLTKTTPELTQAKLQSRLFVDVLSECITDIDGTENRLNNVVVAAKAMNGVILLPGEVFSYNDTLGPRSIARGYLPAPAYIGGKTVDDVGGGICQNSSTLYVAVLQANLEIVKRVNHMFAVGYVPDGLDATVAYNAIDFQFRNNTDYPIRIEASVAERKMIVKLHGTDTQHVTVKMETKVLSTTPYQVTYKPDVTIPVGTTKVDTTPYTGRKVQVFRCVYDSQGKLISRTQENVSNYRYRDKVILYNPEDAQRLGLVDENGVVHTTVQPKPPVQEQPASAPVEALPEDPNGAVLPQINEQPVGVG